MMERVPRSEDYDVDSTDNDDKIDNKENERNRHVVDENYTDAVGNEVQNYDDVSKNNEDIEITENQGADENIIKEDIPSIDEYDEVSVEDVNEEDHDTYAVVEPVETIPRSRTRSGLRNIKNPPGSHRNRYEREFSYLTTSYKKRKNSETVAIIRNDMSRFMDVIITQLLKDENHAHVSMKEGLTRHGNKVLKTLLKEFGQLHKYDIFDPHHMNTMTSEVKKKL